MIYTFSVTNILPEMMREMTNPREMHKSWAAAQAVAMPLFTLFGFWGFYLYGLFNQQATFSVQFSPGNPWMIAYNIFALFGNLLPSVYNQLAVFLKVELSLGVMPTDWWGISFPEYAIFPKIPPVLFRFVFRTVVLVVYVFFATATLSMGIGNIQGLIGALAVAGFSFYLPWILYWKVFNQEMSTIMKVVCFFWFGLGLGAAIMGTVASGSSMAQMSGGFFVFPEDICPANSFYMGVFGGGGAKNDDRAGAFSKSKGPGSFYQTFYKNTCHPPELGGDGDVNFDCAQPDVHCCSWDFNASMVTCQAQKESAPAFSGSIAFNMSAESAQLHV